MVNRERKIDISTLKEEEADSLSIQLGERIKEICETACEKANKLLGVYGMNAKMQIVIEYNEPKDSKELSSN